MKNSTILAVLNHETDDQFIETTAETFAPLQIHMACFLMSPGVEFPMAVYGIPPYRNVEVSNEWKQLLDEALDLQKKRVDEIELLIVTEK